MSDPLGIVITAEVAGGLAVWQISHRLEADGEIGAPKATGAWVIDPDDEGKLAKLSMGWLVLGKGVPAQPALQGLATVIGREHEALTQEYEEEVVRRRVARKSPIQRPLWFPIPALDEEAPVRFETPLALRPVITLTTWTVRLLTVWKHTETTRLRRKYLAAFRGTDARLFPPGWPDRSPGSRCPAARGASRADPRARSTA